MGVALRHTPLSRIIIVLAYITGFAGRYDIARRIRSTKGNWHKVILLKKNIITTTIGTAISKEVKALLPICMSKSSKEATLKTQPFLCRNTCKVIDTFTHFRDVSPFLKPGFVTFRLKVSTLSSAFLWARLTTAYTFLAVFTILPSLMFITLIMSLARRLAFTTRAILAVSDISPLATPIFKSLLYPIWSRISEAVAILTGIAMAVRCVAVGVKCFQRFRLLTLVARLHKRAPSWTRLVVRASAGVPKRGHEKTADRHACSHMGILSQFGMP